MTRAMTALGLASLTLAVVLVAQRPAPYRGTTHCEGGQAVSEQWPHLSPRDSTETIAHESVHRRQLAAGCDSITTLWAEDFALKMDAEAEALCVGMRAAGLSDVERRARVIEAARWWVQYRGAWSFAEYLTMFTSWCVP